MTMGRGGTYPESCFCSIGGRPAGCMGSKAAVVGNGSVRNEYVTAEWLVVVVVVCLPAVVTSGKELGECLASTSCASSSLQRDKRPRE